MARAGVLSRFTALLPDRTDLRQMRRRPRRDLLAGLTVAVVALPLALGFGVSSGLGAEAGLATAVIAGALAAVFGGSNLQVSGPTGAMTVVLVPIVADHGPSGVLTVGLMAGLMLVVLALLRAGGSMRYVPAPVVEGFTLGIACVIGLQQIPNALGVSPPDAERVLEVAWLALQDFVRRPDWAAPALAVAVAAVMLLGARWKPTVPFSILAVIGATLLSEAAGLGVRPIGDLPSGLPAPSLGFVDTAALGSLVAPAVAVAALAALESLLSASVADGMTVGQRHDPDRELFGQGIANIASPLFGGVPATGAIARTAVNVRTGATSRLASLAHAAVLAVIVFAAAPLVSRIPLAALAGVLLATAVRMVEVGSLRAMARATRSDALILVLTAVATLVLDLVLAVIIGLAVAAVLALSAVARQARLAPLPLDRQRDHSDAEHELLTEHIVAYRVDGPLFFAAAHRFLLELTELADVRVVILRMSHVSVVDATGALVLKDAMEKLARRGIVVMVSGIRAEHRQVLDSVGVLDLLRDGDGEYATTPEAIRAARDLLHRTGVFPPDGGAGPAPVTPPPGRPAPTSAATHAAARETP
ncbi:SulP family inorganic anion transporter [Streptomyces sp. NPDC014603]|jgi:SulP family sulfate permease|uniref:SulP family inorganic anion transporter n=1 Tax=unclassified Streptomyces TaxID=2593676 RepID=UPI00363D1108